jgi:glycosyltransferase involved in cell wall biosynthesis
MFVEKDWLVELATPNGSASIDFLSALPDGVKRTQHVTNSCDVALIYASDNVYNFDKDPWTSAMDRIQAGRKVMALTYKLGKVLRPAAAWSKNWDLYLFLSSAMREGFIKRIYETGDADIRALTDVLSPPVDLDPFLKVEPDYAAGCLVRHSSQGDKKFPPDLADILKATPKFHYCFKPGPTQGPDGGPFDRLWNCENADFFPYDSRAEYVGSFLGNGSCFWYLLPTDYTDQGPRVIVEAMAAGLPVLAENRDGAADRVTPETGWLIDDHDQAVEIINSLTPEILAEKGAKAAARAINEFDRWKWFEAIRGSAND